MANTPSARKAIRKIETRSAVNRHRRSRVKTFIRKVMEANAANDQKAARLAFVQAEAEIARAAGKGVVPKGRAKRKISQLARIVKTTGN